MGIQTQQVRAQSREATLPRRGTAPAQRPSGLRRGPRSCSPALPSRLGSHRTAGVHHSPRVCRAVSRTCAGQGVSTSLGHTSGTSREKTNKQTPRPSSKTEWRHSARQRHEGGGPAPLTDWRTQSPPARAPQPMLLTTAAVSAGAQGPAPARHPGLGLRGPPPPAQTPVYPRKADRHVSRGSPERQPMGRICVERRRAQELAHRTVGTASPESIGPAGRQGVSPPGGHAGLSSLKKSLQLTG